MSSTQTTNDIAGEPTLLVIDDDAYVGRSITRILEGEPFRVLHAFTEASAREILQSERVDVVICDRHIPGSDGLTILNALRDAYPKIVRIMLTSDEASSTFIRALSDGGVRRFLCKPWVDEQLRGSVRQAFGLPVRTWDAERHKPKPKAPTATPPPARRGSLARIAALLGVDDGSK